MDLNATVSILCGLFMGIVIGLSGHLLTKRVRNVRLNARLRGQDPPPLARLIPQELYEMLKVILRVFHYLFGMVINSCFAAIRHFKPTPIRMPSWPGSRSSSEEDGLPIPTPYIQDAGMLSGSTRDFRPGLPSNNQHLIESREQQSFENPRVAPPPPSQSKATIATLKEATAVEETVSALPNVAFPALKISS